MEILGGALELKKSIRQAKVMALDCGVSSTADISIGDSTDATSGIRRWFI